MGCQCEIEVDIDGDRASFHRITNHVARKPHKCLECGRVINPGERYEKVVGKWDDNISTNCTCAECKEIRDCFMCNWYYGGVWEEMWEYFSWKPEALCIGKLDALTPKAREVMVKWVDELLKSINEDEDEQL